ncbi:hypothetical protein HYG87_00590 [Methanobacterium alkalithermotolerans]|uniref:Uncharacterized protein n=1 Tax=Methanobacterium alkalithermotolerans TaxID=2731220 RepID=A0A8T8K1M5_9EURY|nr:hypothetical protein [Methanobacterium alkalithermotolerans]QUH22366.1 hypothetical protein HYG87_00590 [Methanobacterium alkalithermotolerans]
MEKFILDSFKGELIFNSDDFRLEIIPNLDIDKQNNEESILNNLVKNYQSVSTKKLSGNIIHNKNSFYISKVNGFDKNSKTYFSDLIFKDSNENFFQIKINCKNRMKRNNLEKMITNDLDNYEFCI